jgi:hypothetical protein
LFTPALIDAACFAATTRVVLPNSARPFLVRALNSARTTIWFGCLPGSSALLHPSVLGGLCMAGWHPCGLI